MIETARVGKHTELIQYEPTTEMRAYMKQQVSSYQSQLESDKLFEMLAKNGPMEVSPDGEIRKIEE